MVNQTVKQKLKLSIGMDAQRNFRTESRMMAKKYRNKKNQGVMFRKRYKENANQPDFVGTFAIENGREYEFAGWHATGRKSLKQYVRLRVTPKES